MDPACPGSGGEVVGQFGGGGAGTGAPGRSASWCMCSGPYGMPVGRSPVPAGSGWFPRTAAEPPLVPGSRAAVGRCRAQQGAFPLVGPGDVEQPFRRSAEPVGLGGLGAAARQDVREVRALLASLSITECFARCSRNPETRLSEAGQIEPIARGRVDDLRVEDAALAARDPVEDVVGAEAEPVVVETGCVSPRCRPT